MLAQLAPAQAQDGLSVAQVFSQFGHSKGCKMVEMHDAMLRGYRLHVYKSLTYKRLGASVDQLLRADQKRARKIREVVDNGRVSSGYYQMEPTPAGMNRFILYSRQPGQSGTVVYIEGRLSADDIMQLCYAKY